MKDEVETLEQWRKSAQDWQFIAEERLAEIRRLQTLVANQREEIRIINEKVFAGYKPASRQRKNGGKLQPTAQ